MVFAHSWFLQRVMNTLFWNSKMAPEDRIIKLDKIEWLVLLTGMVATAGVSPVAMPLYGVWVALFFYLRAAQIRFNTSQATFYSFLAAPVALLFHLSTGQQLVAYCLYLSLVQLVLIFKTREINVLKPIKSISFPSCNSSFLLTIRWNSTFSFSSSYISWPSLLRRYAANYQTEVPVKAPSNCFLLR